MNASNLVVGCSYGIVYKGEARKVRVESEVLEPTGKRASGPYVKVVDLDKSTPEQVAYRTLTLADISAVSPYVSPFNPSYGGEMPYGC